MASINGSALQDEVNAGTGKAAKKKLNDKKGGKTGDISRIIKLIMERK